MRAVVSIILLNILLERIFVTVAIECSVYWSILTKPIRIGQDLQLECNIGDKDICPGNPRWSGGPDNQVISVGNVVYNQEKYDITNFPGKYIMTIRDIRKADLSSRYICHVKFDKFEAIIKDKDPTYSLNISQPKSLQGDLRIFANISAVPLNRTKNQHRWLRYPVHNSTKTEDLPNSEKFKENMEDDGISLTVKNLTKKDVNMTYELIYSNAKFSGDVILQLISTGSSKYEKLIKNSPIIQKVRCKTCSDVNGRNRV
ncbi:Hypothetical predicted protein [Mytilus galloprovincialis]|uniref:Ig-like domain-containing protein n=1 Tax=Mytilus galloprovincialis TaxID=29158 RepID=A0A8B6HHL3_MYTGA|nr:Hypothetical predicted protein [Mytilus galloprovincialis]